MNIFKRLWNKVTGSSSEGASVMTLVEGDPNLAEQFHPHRNGGLSAEDIVYEDSPTAYWWMCQVDSNHVWESPLAVRVRAHSRCPFCAQQEYFSDPSNSIDISSSEATWQDGDIPEGAVNRPANTGV